MLIRTDSDESQMTIVWIWMQIDYSLQQSQIWPTVGYVPPYRYPVYVATRYPDGRADESERSARNYCN
jgi:hypothetical protein